MTALETYKHYKGGLYIKHYEAMHTETEEILVIYSCCVRGHVFARPKDQFYSTIEIDGKPTPRFSLIDRQMPREDVYRFLKDEF